MICRYADRIAYLSHDLDDALRAGVITRSDVPQDVVSVLGPLNNRNWIEVMIEAVVEESIRRGKIAIRADVMLAMKSFRQFMFERVYLLPAAVARKNRASSVNQVMIELLMMHLE